jgi:hypothetical protein
MMNGEYNKMLNVVVTTADGRQAFTADCAKVLSDMSKAHPKKNW